MSRINRTTVGATIVNKGTSVASKAVPTPAALKTTSSKPMTGRKTTNLSPACSNQKKSKNSVDSVVGYLIAIALVALLIYFVVKNPTINKLNEAFNSTGLSN